VAIRTRRGADRARGACSKQGERNIGELQRREGSGHSEGQRIERRLQAWREGKVRKEEIEGKRSKGPSSGEKDFTAGRLQGT